MDFSKHICFICLDYIYWGKIQVQNEKTISLSDCYIIYDTGKWSDPEWKTAEFVGNWNVQLSAVESWGAVAKVLPGQASYPQEAASHCSTSQNLGSTNGNVQEGGSDE